MFSGKACPETGTAGAFFCYALPAPRNLAQDEIIDTEAERWSTAIGNVYWYFIDNKSEEISQEPRRIAHLIRSSQETPRENQMSKARLVELRKKVEKQIKNHYLRRMNAPAGVKPELRSWMEVN